MPVPPPLEPAALHHRPPPSSHSPTQPHPPTLTHPPANRHCLHQPAFALPVYHGRQQQWHTVRSVAAASPRRDVCAGKAAHRCIGELILAALAATAVSWALCTGPTTRPLLPPIAISTARCLHRQPRPLWPPRSTPHTALCLRAAKQQLHSPPPPGRHAAASASLQSIVEGVRWGVGVPIGRATLTSASPTTRRWSRPLPVGGGQSLLEATHPVCGGAVGRGRCQPATTGEPYGGLVGYPGEPPLPRRPFLAAIGQRVITSKCDKHSRSKPASICQGPAGVVALADATPVECCLGIGTYMTCVRGRSVCVCACLRACTCNSR